MENKKLRLQVLHGVGYLYLTRDWDGAIWVFNKEPKYEEGIWLHKTFDRANQAHQIPDDWGFEDLLKAGEMVLIEELL